MKCPNTDRTCPTPTACYQAKSCGVATATVLVMEARRGQVVGNATVLMFVRGWQGGTIHQIASELDTTPEFILNADYDAMAVLMRSAQAKLRHEMLQRYAEKKAG